MSQPSYGLVCVNGHAMDEGYVECPCCGAYRPPRCLTRGMTSARQQAAIREATADDLDPEVEAKLDEIELGMEYWG
jgi:hypothetical protein